MNAAHTFSAGRLRPGPAAPLIGAGTLAPWVPEALGAAARRLLRA